VADLLDEVVEHLPEQAASYEGEAPAGERIFSIALVGRPNVGKSTLFNRLIGEERSVVHDMPGTTRDTVDTVVETEIGTVRFLDTAGMRRRSRVDDDTEYYSVVRSLKAVDGADVALLVIDATEGVTQQDQRLAERVDAAGCPTVVVLNKTDLLTTEQREDLSVQLARKLSFLPDAGIHRISALSGKGVQKLLPSLGGALAAYQTRVPTRKVNEVVRRAQQAQPAPAGGRILYATQGATDPPTFTLFTNRSLPDHYLRYIERRLREEFDLEGTAMKLRVRLRNE
jgi:GTP-binding protein